MNKTININLAGIVFHIDEEAFDKLQSYLDAVKKSLKGTEGNEEIIADIEARIAELFSERIKEKDVVTKEDVDFIIAKLGQPDDYQVDDSIFDEETTESKKSTKSKRLYRDTDDKIIGGVCSGIGHYLGIDPVWVRIIFILLFFGGFPIIAYLILWIIVPEAATTAQKLEMKGEPANLSNIERKVKEGFENVKKKVDDFDIDETGKKVKATGSNLFGMITSIAGSFFSFLGKLITGIFSLAGKLIGVILIMVSFAVILSIFISFITFSLIDVNFGSDIAPIFLAESFVDFPVWLSSILLILAIGIPFFMLMYLGLKILIKNIKPMSGLVKLSLLGAWLLSIFALIFISINQVATESIRVSENPKIEQLQAVDTLYVKMRTSKHFDRVDPLFNIDHVSMSYDQDGEQILFSRHIRLDIYNSDKVNPTLEISRAAKGRNYKKALERAQKIAYDYELTSNTLYLDNYFTAPKESKIRAQEVEIDLYLPENTVIQLDSNTADYISHQVDNNRDFYRKDMADHFWKMSSNNQLECMDCEQ